MSRDSEVFARIYASYRNSLILRISRLVGDPNLAEEAVQEAFLRAWERSLSTGGNLYGWLYVVARNYAWKDKMRYRKLLSLDGSLQNALSNAHVDDSVLDHDIVAVWEALEGLPPKQREILLLRYEYGLSEEEIGRRLRCTTAAAKARLHRARNALRRALGNLQ